MGFGRASAQIGPGPFAAFPSQSATDGRFLGFGCAGIATFEQNVTIAMAAPAANATFDVNIFDGETGMPDGAARPHWDVGNRQLIYSLYADPLRNGSTSPADLIGTWTGNGANPTSGPLWTSSSSTMPDNDWWAVTVTNGAVAQAPSGNYFYNLVIGLDGSCAPGEVLESNIKVAASNPMTFRTPQFGLVGAFRQLFNDGPILYPGTFPPPGGFLTAPTTYDGTFEFFFTLPGGETELRMFDGDFDFGTASTVGSPSGVALDPCEDEDDFDTAADYSGFPFSTTGANPEGVQGPGIPPDDNNLDAFRRGEPGDPNRIGCVRYEVTDPDGNIYFNDNPSGSFEWEQFLIASINSPFVGDADWVYGGATLPSGMWKVTIIGLDLANLNFWFADTCATRPARDPIPGEDPDNVPRVAACSDESIYLIGDFVWSDTGNPGVLDPGEAGIPGVLMELVRPSDGSVIATAKTGDTTSPNWSACVANNTGTDINGLYCFGMDAPGTYEVRVAASNFGPGKPLEGKSSTTGGESLTRTLSADNELTYDFGYAEAATNDASVGDRIWLDADGDGVQDGGENGINGVTVDLLDNGGNVVASQITSGNGNYLFDNLAAGNYSVRVVTATLPAGLAQTYDLDGTGTANIASFALAQSQNRTDVDFGYRQPPAPGSLGDRVWSDLDGDGVQDAGEVGINGVTVRLLDGTNTVVATQVTSGDGNYTFGNLAAGSYTVVVDSTTLPAGFGPTYDLDGVATPHRATATVAAGQNRTDVDFGYRTHDTETCAQGSFNNPAYGSNPDGHAFYLPGIGLDFQFAPATGSFVQRADGTARLTGIVRRTANSSEAFVVDVVLSGLTATAPPGSPKKELSGNAYSENGGPVNTATFTYYTSFTGTLTGIDAYAGSVIGISNTGSAFQLGTGANNKNLLDGASAWFVWNVTSQPASGPALTQSGQGDINVDFGNCSSCANNANNDPAVLGSTYNHAFWLPGIGTDFQFSPVDGTFVRNADGTAHLTGTMYSLSSPTHGFQVDILFSGYTATTPPGSPKKELSAGAYVENGGVADSASWSYYTSYSGTLVGVSAYAGGSISISSTGPAFQLGVGANNKNLHFGGSGWYQWQVTSQPSGGETLVGSGQGDINLDLFECPPVSYGSIGDRVWNDTNGNGVQDAGETGINGVTVRLVDTVHGVTVETQVTAGDGIYTFAHVVAGTYRVEVVPATLPAGLAATFDLDGLGTANSASFALAAGQNRTDVDFGYRGTASLGDRVWLDFNANGVQDGGEVGINGVTVELLNSGGTVVASQVTSGDGTYNFTNLSAGNYTVRVVSSTLPAGLAPSYDLDGIGTPHTAAASLTAAQNRTDVDFGYRGTASLGDRVWLDFNANGVQDGGEVGINGVTVTLLNSANVALATQVTTGNGNYTFANLPAGTYKVRVESATVPAGLVPSYDLDGVGTAHIATAALTGGQNRTDVDFGYRGQGTIGDRVWEDANGNGVQDGGEAGINGVTVTLLDTGGNALASQVTSGNGNYLFGNLPAGSYSVRVESATLPAGYVQTYDLDGLGTAHRATVALAAGQNRSDVDFGYQSKTDAKSCANQANNDPAYNGSAANHALWLPGIGTDYSFTPDPGAFLEKADGSATLTGTMRSQSNPNNAFTVAINFFARTTTPGPGNPKKELAGSAYVNNGGPIDPATWRYYGYLGGVLTGIDGNAGVVLSITNVGPSFQVGVGANGKNLHYGASGWIHWTATQPSGSSYPSTGQGDINLDIFDCVQCANKADNDSSVNATSAHHAIWLPGISTDLVFSPGNGSLVEKADGTARLTGTLVSTSNPNFGFAVDVTFSGFTTTAPAGNPKKELAASAYSENGGPIKTATWYYYTGATGTLTGTGSAAGAKLNLVRVGPAFQVGTGANGKNLHYGGSGWLNWTVVTQPTSGSALPTSGQGDINVDIGQCPPTTPAPGTGTIGYWKNHASAWPVTSIKIGNETYTVSQAINLLRTPSKGDKSIDLAKQLIAAKLNVLVGNVSSCISATITSADNWLKTYPVGSNVRGSSSAWSQASPWHNMLDDYNNGLLCAPHRD